MSIQQLSRGLARGVLVLSLIAGAAACGNPVDPDVHQEPVGMVITDVLGAVIAETSGSGSSMQWTITGGADALRLTRGSDLEVRVFFVDEDGQRFQVTNDPEFSLRVVFSPTGIVEYIEGGDRATLRALQVGGTSARFELLHGDHPDWTSPGLALVVEEPAA